MGFFLKHLVPVSFRIYESNKNNDFIIFMSIALSLILISLPFYFLFILSLNLSL